MSPLDHLTCAFLGVGAGVLLLIWAVAFAS